MLERLKNRRADDEGGFTLIELLVVIIILGILAAVVVFAVGGISDKGQTNACKIDTRTLRTAAEARFAQTGTYGQTPADWDGTAPANPPATPTVLDEKTLYVDAGFLSEVSTLHNFQVIDTNTKAPGDPAKPTITPTIQITVVDTAKCGGTAAGDVVGTNGAI